jgi:hypothetical protein
MIDGRNAFIKVVETYSDPTAKEVKEFRKKEARIVPYLKILRLILPHSLFLLVL